MEEIRSDLDDSDRFERIECEHGVAFINKKCVPLDSLPSRLYVEWGGSLRCLTSDGRIVNIAEELNRIENELDKC